MIAGSTARDVTLGVRPGDLRMRRPACRRASSASRTSATAASSTYVAGDQLLKLKSDRVPTGAGRRARLRRLRARRRPPVRRAERRAARRRRIRIHEGHITMNAEDPPTERRPDPQRRHGLLRHRLLRRRGRDAEPRPAGRERPALQPVLQHRALQPVARIDADRPASAPDRRRHPDLRLGPRGLRRQPEPALRDDPAGAEGATATAPT